MVVHTVPYVQPPSPWQRSINFHIQSPNLPPNQKIDRRKCHCLRKGQSKSKLFKLVGMHKNLVFVKPSSIWDCNPEVQIMSQFTDECSRAKQWHNRILIPTAMINFYQYMLQQPCSKSNKVRDLKKLFLFIRFWILPEYPNRNTILDNLFENRKDVDVTIGIAVA